METLSIDKPKIESVLFMGDFKKGIRLIVLFVNNKK